MKSGRCSEMQQERKFVFNFYQELNPLIILNDEGNWYLHILLVGLKLSSIICNYKKTKQKAGEVWILCSN